MADSTASIIAVDAGLSHATRDYRAPTRRAYVSSRHTSSMPDLPTRSDPIADDLFADDSAILAIASTGRTYCAMD